MNCELNKRLLSLDVLRGLTVALMILVNNGAGHEHFHQLTHSQWNGMTLCDLVFPFFLFMVGVSISFSLSKYTTRRQPATGKKDHSSKPTTGRKDHSINPTASAEMPSKAPVIKKILIRTLKMFLIGVLLHAWDMWVGGKTDILANLRIWGVLERIALCYCAASFIVLYVKPRYLWYIVIGSLLAYCTILVYGNGYAEDETNIAAIIDRSLLGTAHLYHKSPIDPEGLLGTLPAISHTLIGVIIGSIIRRKESLILRLRYVSLIAVILILAGALLSFSYPLNKRIWSPSYVLLTCGIASALLTLFTYLIDCRHSNGISTKMSHSGYDPKCDVFVEKVRSVQLLWYRPCQWFGMNAIVLYVVSEMLAPVMGRLEVGDKMYAALMEQGFTAEWASVTYAICFVLVMTLIAWAMYKRKIFVKL